MFPFSTYVTKIGDTYLVAVSTADAVLIAVFGLALLLGAMWLANSPQPTPSKGLWALSAADREVKARGRHR